MSRIRTVKPEFFTHQGLFQATTASQLPLRCAFIGLFTCCDRHGRFRWDPTRLKLKILPYDSLDFSEVLEALAQAGFLRKYAYRGELYGCIPSWHKHQKINHRESPSILPAPDNLESKLCVPYASDLPKEASLRHSESANEKTRAFIHACHTDEAPIAPIDQACPAAPGEGEGEWILERHDLGVEEILEATHSALDERHGSFIAPPFNNTFEDCFESPEPSSSLSVLEASSKHEPCLARTDRACPGIPGGNRKGNWEYGTGKREEEGKGSLRGRDFEGGKLPSPPVQSEIPAIFEHWKTVMRHPQAQLDPKRRTLIQRALKLGYSATQLCEAINGCSLTPHNQGHNDKGQRFDGLQVIFRNADQIDRFRHNYQHPPRILSAADQQQAQNIQALQAWVLAKQGAPNHGSD